MPVACSLLVVRTYLSGSNDVGLRLYGASAEQGRPVRNASRGGEGGGLEALESAFCSSKPTIGAIKSGDRFAGSYNKVWSPAPFLALETRHVTSNTRRFRGQNLQESTHISDDVGALAAER